VYELIEGDYGVACLLGMVTARGAETV